MSLKVELKVFGDHKLEWLEKHEGRFALIKGEEYSFHDSDEDAYKAGLEKYGDTDVFIKQILPEDQVEDSLALLYGLVNVTP